MPRIDVCNHTFGVSQSSETQNLASPLSPCRMAPTVLILMEASGACDAYTAANMRRAEAEKAAERGVDT